MKPTHPVSFLGQVESCAGSKFTISANLGRYKIARTGMYQSGGSDSASQLLEQMLQSENTDQIRRGLSIHIAFGHLLNSIGDV